MQFVKMYVLFEPPIRKGCPPGIGELNDTAIIDVSMMFTIDFHGNPVDGTGAVHVDGRSSRILEGRTIEEQPPAIDGASIFFQSASDDRRSVCGIGVISDDNQREIRLITSVRIYCSLVCQLVHLMGLSLPKLVVSPLIASFSATLTFSLEFNVSDVQRVRHLTRSPAKSMVLPRKD